VMAAAKVAETAAVRAEAKAEVKAEVTVVVAKVVVGKEAASTSSGARRQSVDSRRRRVCVTGRVRYRLRYRYRHRYRYRTEDWVESKRQRLES